MLALTVGVLFAGIHISYTYLYQFSRFNHRQLVCVTRAAGAGPARWTMGRGPETCYGCDRRSRGCSRRSDLIFASGLLLSFSRPVGCEPVPGFEGPPPVAVDARMHMQACLHACREGRAKQARLSRFLAGWELRRSPLFCSSRLVMFGRSPTRLTALGMICMGLEGRSPGESRGLCLADAVFRRLGKKDELQSRMRLVYSRNGDMGKRSQGWGSVR